MGDKVAKVARVTLTVVGATTVVFVAALFALSASMQLVERDDWPY